MRDINRLWEEKTNIKQMIWVNDGVQNISLQSVASDPNTTLPTMHSKPQTRQTTGGELMKRGLGGGRHRPYEGGVRIQSESQERRILFKIRNLNLII